MVAELRPSEPWGFAQILRTAWKVLRNRPFFFLFSLSFFWANEKKIILGKDITAFFACNDLMAVGILNGCSEMSINVPNEVSVIGFDNIILSQIIRPKLSTVNQNMKKLGTAAAENIVKLIENKELRCENVIIETQLIIRDSCSK